MRYFKIICIWCFVWWWSVLYRFNFANYNEVLGRYPKNYSFTSLFKDKKIKVLAYNLETILAEKIETILSRGVANTRARDFYDIYILHKLYADKINYSNLKNAITATLEKRNTLYLLDDYKIILKKISKDSGIADLWNRYKKTFDYTSEASLTESLDIVHELMNKILSI